MSLLDSNDLTWMRAMVSDLLPDTCVIQRDSAIAGTSDAYGFVTPSWGTAGTVYCRADPVSGKAGKAGEVAGREALRNYYQFSFEHDADVQTSDRIVYDSDTYEIVELYDDHSWRVSRRALCSKIQGA